MKAFQWKNFSWQTLNYAVSGFLLLFLWVVMANQWSAEEFGQFSALFAFIAVYAGKIRLIDNINLSL